MGKQFKQLAIVLLLVFGLHWVSQSIYIRLDLTQNQRYTLSEHTQNQLASLDQTLLIQVYLEGDFPSEFQRLQIETRQLLEEFTANTPQVQFQFINPDAIRSSLVKKGMIPSTLTVEEDGKISEAIIFPWAELHYGSKSKIVSLLPSSPSQNQESQLQNAIEGLEYAFVHTLSTLLEKEPKKIAVLTGNGMLEDIYVFSFLKALSSQYKLAKFTLDSVENAPIATSKKLNAFDAVIIAKPTIPFTEKEKLVLDQYALSGGNMLWMVDQVQADTDSLFNDGKMLAYPRDLNVSDLFFSYGVRVNTSLVQDLYAAKIPLATGTIGNQTQFQSLPWFYYPLVTGNPYHPITKNVLPVRLRFVNQIDTLTSPIAKIPLLLSSPLSQKTGVPKIISLQSIAEQPNEANYRDDVQLLGVLLEGNFTSMYRNRIKPFEYPNYSAQGKSSKIVLIADGDIAKNDILKGEPYDLETDKWTKTPYGNKSFLLNTMEYLVGREAELDLKNKTIPIALLDKQRAFRERTYWQWLNVVLPLLVLTVFGGSFYLLRKRKLSRKIS